MKSICFLLVLSSPAFLQAQYYYNDIIGTTETNRLMNTYRVNKVKTIIAAGFDPRGVKATDFSEFHEISVNGTALKTSTVTGFTKTVVYSRFDDKGKLISTTDSAAGVITTTRYEYDAAGRLSIIENSVTGSTGEFNQTEAHHWLYHPSGKPDKMWRIIRQAGQAEDSLEIRFVADENGNIGEERSFRKGQETGYLYYYYDDKNRVTDIVRYNTKMKRLLPDVMFEYDDQDRVVQKITPTSSSSLGYLIWRYVFDAKGLKSKEALFNDDKQMTGKIEYSFTYY